MTVPTDITGKANVGFTMGFEAGQHIISANFAGNPHSPVQFQLSGKERTDAATTFSGIVVNNSYQPLGNAACELTVSGQHYAAITSSEGQFHFDGVVGGIAEFHVDGSTINTIGGNPIPTGVRFPQLHYTENLVHGTDNRKTMPVLLPPLMAANDVPYDGTEDVELILPGVEDSRSRSRQVR